MDEPEQEPQDCCTDVHNRSSDTLVGDPWEGYSDVARECSEEWSTDFVKRQDERLEKRYASASPDSCGDDATFFLSATTCKLTCENEYGLNTSVSSTACSTRASLCGTADSAEVAATIAKYSSRPSYSRSLNHFGDTCEPPRAIGFASALKPCDDWPELAGDLGNPEQQVLSVRLTRSARAAPQARSQAHSLLNSCLQPDTGLLGNALRHTGALQRAGSLDTPPKHSASSQWLLGSHTLHPVSDNCHDDLDKTFKPIQEVNIGLNYC